MDICILVVYVPFFALAINLFMPRSHVFMIDVIFQERECSFKS